MSGSILILYTTIGGVIGSGLTQYATHIHGRRISRASVVEKITEAEGVLTVLRSLLSDSTSPQTVPQLLALAGSLEAAGLISGLPRELLKPYINSCRLYDTIYRIADKQRRISQAIEVRPIGSKQELEKMRSMGKDLQQHADALEEPLFKYHDAALEELSLALWHPISAQLRRSKLRQLQKQNHEIDCTIDELSPMLRQMTRLYEQAIATTNRKSSTSPENPDQSLD